MYCDLNDQGSTDPYWNQTALLLKTSGSLIYDAKGKAIELNGNISVSSAVTKFGAPVIYCDGSGDFILNPVSADFNFGSADFSIETWVYFLGTNGSTNYSSLGDGTLFSINANQADWKTGGGYLAVRATYINYLNSSSGESSSTPFSSPTNNAWHFYLITKTGNTLNIYVDGVLVRSVSNIATSIGNGTSKSGFGLLDSNGGGRAFFYGYITEYRITKGVVRPNIVPVAPF